MPGSNSRGAARWSLIFPGDVPCAGTADRRDTISSLLAEQNTGTWCVCSCVTLLGPAQLAPQGSPRWVPLGVVPLCWCGTSSGSVPSLPAHLKTHKIEGSCKFTATCPGNHPVLPRWRSPGPFPGVLPTGACSECFPGRGLKAWHPPGKPDHEEPPTGRGCPRFPRPGSGSAWGSKSKRESSKKAGWEWAGRWSPATAAVRNEVTF